MYTIDITHLQFENAIIQITMFCEALLKSDSAKRNFGLVAIFTPPVLQESSEQVKKLSKICK
jgi:hypothetical protein